jgi:hypothetical protein
MEGFIDGEGHISINRQIRKDRPSPSYRAYVTVANTERESLIIFQEYYGGNIYLRRDKRRDKMGNKWADSYAWYCPISSTKRLLQDVLPYLRLKNRQANIVLEFIAKKNGFARGKRKGRGGSSPLTREEIGFRERLRREVRLMNRKGKFARNNGGGG